MTQSCTGPSQIVRCHRWQTTAFRVTFTIAQITLGVKPCPQILPALLIDRGNGPAVMPAPRVQLSTASFTHCGTGIVPDVATFSSQVSDDPMAFPEAEDPLTARL